MYTTDPMRMRLLQFDRHSGALPQPANQNVQRTYDAMLGRGLVGLDLGVYYITHHGFCELHGIVQAPDYFYEDHLKGGCTDVD